MGRGDINQPRATSGQFVGIDAALPEPDGNNAEIAVLPDASADFKPWFLKGDSVMVGFQNTASILSKLCTPGPTMTCSWRQLTPRERTYPAI